MCHARRLSIQRGTSFLAPLDKDWARLISEVGECTRKPRPEPERCEALIRAVAYQHLHAKTGDAVLRKLLALLGSNRFPYAKQLLATDIAELFACGFSAQKFETIME